MSCSVEIAAITDACTTCCLLAPNYEKITDFAEHSRWDAAHVVALPELCRSGYGFHSRAEAHARTDGSNTTPSVHAA